MVIYYLRSKNTFWLLKTFVYGGLGIGFISFFVLNLALIFSFLSKTNNFYICVYSTILIFLFSSFSYLNANNIHLKNIKITSSKIKKSYSFIFISDIHLGTNNSKYIKKILKKISELNYNFILIGGDLIDSSSYNIEELSIFKKINKPILCVTGNHEYYIEDYKKKLSKFNKYNLCLLENKNYIFDEINIIGIDDKQTIEKQIFNFRKFSSISKYNITLVHKPLIWEQIIEFNDLMLSGHTHKGQIFPFNLLVKIKFKYLYGLYSRNSSKLYVTSGVGCWGPKMRLGSQNEIVHIEIN